MAGRLNEKQQQIAEDLKPVRFCATVGCEGKALSYSTSCENCETRVRQEKSEARCRELGLVTVEDKRAYCRKLARSFGRGPIFETWAKNMRQSTVDRLALMAAGQEDQCLERLRSIGVIDGRNKLIPLEAREVAADVYRQDRARELVKLQRELAERALKEQQAQGAAP